MGRRDGGWILRSGICDKSPRSFDCFQVELRVRGHLRRYDLVRIADRLAALDLVDVLHALGHLAPDGVLTVEERGIPEADEELAIAGIRALRTRHRHRAAHVLLAVELRLQLLARAAGAGPVRTAGLRHEAIDD